MVVQGNRNSGFTLRALLRAGSIGLRLAPNSQDRESLQRAEDRIPTRRQRETMGNSQTQNCLDTSDSSDRSDEGCGMDDSSEESVEVCLGHGYEAGVSNARILRRQKKQDVTLLDHEVAHVTKLGTAPNGMLSAIYGENHKGYVSTFSMLSGREANVSGRSKFSTADCCHVASRYLPTGGPVEIDKMNSRAYVSQFSKDGSLFVAGFQDHRIRIYNVEKGWVTQKDVLCRHLRWTITDTSLSPDQKFLVYASITPIVHIVNIGHGGIESVGNITEIHEGLDFSVDGEDSFGLFCIKYATDGRELVAGSSDNSIYIYDLEANKRSLRIVAHKDDVNTVAFADETGKVIYSASDDKYCKIWDRRCITSRGQPVGSLAGHLDGITFIDSRGDGRYFISNGKDQAIKLWDIRKMTSGNPTPKSRKVRSIRWDYRWMDYPATGKDLKHPYDQSIMTYKGHVLLRTLIRCYFSPVFSTAQRYIYTGSHDGCVHIYDVVTGQQVAKLNHHSNTVRDCSWHPLYPTLVSSSWDGAVVKWDLPSAYVRES